MYQITSENKRADLMFDAVMYGGIVGVILGCLEARHKSQANAALRSRLDRKHLIMLLLIMPLTLNALILLLCALSMLLCALSMRLCALSMLLCALVLTLSSMMINQNHHPKINIPPRMILVK